ncbi:MAG: hypothetical protein ACE5DS_09735 [Kiloniellaceae bacterium]
MNAGLPIRKYQFTAALRDGVVEWSIGIETDDGEQHLLAIRDGEEVPVLREMCRSDTTIYYDPESRTFRTGWNIPGKEDRH